MISATVNLHGNFAREAIRRAERVVPVELAAAAEVGAKVSSAAAHARHRTGKMSEMELLEVHGTPTGWEGGYRSAAWYANFQNKGTKRGITPMHFMEKGRTAARKELVARLNRRLGST